VARHEIGCEVKSGNFVPVLIVLVGVLLSAIPAGSGYADEKSRPGNKINLFAVSEGKAILVIEKKRRVLKIGQTSPEGVTLLKTNTANEIVTIRVDGKEQELGLNSVLGSSFQKGNAPKVTLYSDRIGQYQTDGHINGKLVRFLVDTGASTIALSSVTAKKIGLDYLSLGRPSVASTASGYVRMYEVKLTTVKVGAITLYNVDAGVIEGTHPTEVLLGMSFLGKLKVKQEGNKMELMKKY